MSEKQLRNLDEQTIRILLDNVPFAMAIFDNTEILVCNQRCTKMLQSEQYNYSIPDIFHAFRDAYGPTRKEIVLLNANLDKHWIEIMGEPVWYNNSIVILGFLTDITASGRSERDTEQAKYLHQLMLEINHSIVEIEDIQKTFTLILTNALKAIKDSALGTIMVVKDDHFETLSYIGYGEDIKTFMLPIEHAFLYRATDGLMDRIVNIGNLKHDDQFYRITTFAGNEIYIKSHMAAPIYVKGELYGMICLDALIPDAFDDNDVESMEFIRSNIQIAIRNQLQSIEKAQLAMFDQLTGMYNRHYFLEHFEMVKNRAMRYDEKFQLILFDIDDLKQINDHYGHAVGDQAILKITSQLQKNTRKSDMIARYGGDEFIGVFFGTNASDLISKYDAIASELDHDPIKIGFKNVLTRFSYGIVEFPTDGKTLDELFEMADIRMYTNKNKKNTK